MDCTAVGAQSWDGQRHCSGRGLRQQFVPVAWRRHGEGHVPAIVYTCAPWLPSAFLRRQPRRTYNPQDGRGSKKPATQQQAMAELVDVVKTLKPDGFTPTVVKQTDDYLYVEYESPTFGVSGAAAGQGGGGAGRPGGSLTAIATVMLASQRLVLMTNTTAPSQAVHVRVRLSASGRCWT